MSNLYIFFSTKHGIDEQATLVIFLFKYSANFYIFILAHVFISDAKMYYHCLLSNQELILDSKCECKWFCSRDQFDPVM